MVHAESVETTGEGPSPRRAAAGGVFDGFLYVFGGADKTGKHYSDIWRLDLVSKEWECLSEGIIRPRRLPGLSYGGGQFILFGGRTENDTFFNDLWRVDADGVEKIPYSGPRPTPRYAPSQVAVDGAVYLFGGTAIENGEHVFFDDTWRFAPSNARWERITRTGPSPRYGAATVAQNEQLFLFGGRYQQGGWWYHDDTWRFNCDTNEWQLLDTDPTPPARYVPGITRTDEAIYMYGGVRCQLVPIDTPWVRRVHQLMDRIRFPYSYFPSVKRLRFLSDLWKFTTESGWEQLSPDIGLPPLKTPVMGHRDGSLIIGFGKSQSTYYDTVWEITDYE